jgi:hypothetical protein
MGGWLYTNALNVQRSYRKPDAGVAQVVENLPASRSLEFKTQPRHKKRKQKIVRE